MSHPSKGAKIIGIDGWLVYARDSNGQEWTIDTEYWPEWDSPSEAVGERRVMKAAEGCLHLDGLTLFGGCWEKVQT